MQEVPRPTHEIQDEPVDLFYKAIKAQERLQREYLDYRLANVSAPFSEATKAADMGVATSRQNHSVDCGRTQGDTLQDSPVG